MVFCQVIAYVHDHIPGEIAFMDILRFMDLMFQVIYLANRSSYSRVLAKHGLQVIHQNHPPQQAMIPIVHAIFDPFSPRGSILMDIAYPNHIFKVLHQTPAQSDIQPLLSQMRVKTSNKMTWW
jgi:hypothetical protein